MNHPHSEPPFGQNYVGQGRPPSLFDVEVDAQQLIPPSSAGGGEFQHEEMEYVVKMRGCPWAMTVDDVIDFFGPECQIMGDREGIHLVKTSEGRATGECFVEMLTERDVEQALTKDHQTMGHRYIEVYKVKKVEMDWILKRSRPDEHLNGSGSQYRGRAASGPVGGGGGGGGYGVHGGEAETFVRLRGLPYECTVEDIEQFFSGLAIAPNGIQLVVDSGGKVTGEAYCQFQSRAGAEMALQRDRESIGHRYVEIFRVTNTELRNSLNSMVHRNNRQYSYGNRPSPYDRPSNQQGRAGMGRQQMSMGNQRSGAGPNRFYGGRGNNIGNSSNGGGGEGYGHSSGQSTWSDYASRVENSWDVGHGGSPQSLKPGPRPLLPGLKGNQRMHGPVGGGGGGGCGGGNGGDFPVLMRGLPWSATEGDIRNFFAPIHVIGAEIIFDDTNRPSGSARAFFTSPQDQNEALHKHRNMMGSRYIELFIE